MSKPLDPPVSSCCLAKVYEEQGICVECKEHCDIIEQPSDRKETLGEILAYIYQKGSVAVGTDIDYLASYKPEAKKEINKAIKAIRAYYKGLVPEEKTSDGAGMEWDKGARRGYNSCREDMIERIEGS